MQDIENLKKIDEALKYLETIPLLQPVLQDLPKDIAYEFSDDTPGMACYDSFENKITIRPERMNCDTPQKRLDMHVSLAHELCHANQKQAGLLFNDLKDASFGDTFRVARMMEIETGLQDAIIENELLKREEFKDCQPSIPCQLYRQKLKDAGNNVSMANANFILTYWRNANDDITLSDKMKKAVDSTYNYYITQAYHHAYFMTDPRFNLERTSTGRHTPFQVMTTYLKRMNVKTLQPKLFLANAFDNVVTTHQFQNGVTLIGQNGNLILNMQPTKYRTLDMLTYFKNDQPHANMVRHARTGIVIPWSMFVLMEATYKEEQQKQKEADKTIQKQTEPDRQTAPVRHMHASPQKAKPLRIDRERG